MAFSILRLSVSEKPVGASARSAVAGQGIGSGGGSESLVTCQQRSGERRHLRGDQRHIGKSEAGEARPDRSLEVGLH